jgi:hypothetical protein
MDPDFPCHFGTVAEKSEKIYYAYVHHKEDPMLPKIITEFLQQNHKFDNKLGLALFVPPEKNTLSFEEYKENFWDIMNFLQINNPLPWPKDQVHDPDEPLWNFCFNGEPLFVFANFPAYQNRRSRNLGNSLVIMIQSVDIFNGIEPGTPSGAKARKNIRERIKRYDYIEPHPNLGHARAAVKHPWKLYVLPDDMNKLKGKCPFQHKDKIDIDK